MQLRVRESQLSSSFAWFQVSKSRQHAYFPQLVSRQTEQQGRPVLIDDPFLSRLSHFLAWSSRDTRVDSVPSLCIPALYPRKRALEGPSS
jgi:hypothetical protein